MLVHVDDVRETRAEGGAMATTWQDLGRAAGSVAVGVRRARTDPGRHATPLHAHGSEEELFYVLGGGGACLEEAPGSAARLRAGDLVVRRAGGRGHVFVAGEQGLEFLAFGERSLAPGVRMPRGDALWLGRTWAETGAGDHPLRREAQAGPLPVPDALERPPWVANEADVARDPWGEGDVATTWQELAVEAGSQRTGLSLVRVQPGRRNAPPHCHSAEEELFYVLAGSGHLELGWPGEAHPVRAGHLVARRAGTGVAHSFVAGDDGLVLLAYGQRDPNDMCAYPRSGKVSLRGLGVIVEVTRASYWDGER